MNFGDNADFYVSVKVYFFPPLIVSFKTFSVREEDLNAGSVIGIYKTATSSRICRGCEKGVGSLSLCLGFSSETEVSTSQRHTCWVFVKESLNHLLDQHRPQVV